MQTMISLHQQNAAQSEAMVKETQAKNVMMEIHLVLMDVTIHVFMKLAIFVQKVHLMYALRTHLCRLLNILQLLLTMTFTYSSMTL